MHANKRLRDRSRIRRAAAREMFRSAISFRLASVFGAILQQYTAIDGVRYGRIFVRLEFDDPTCARLESGEPFQRLVQRDEIQLRTVERIHCHG